MLGQVSQIQTKCYPNGAFWIRNDANKKLKFIDIVNNFFNFLAFSKL